jgi:hypothetical protein
MNKAKRKSGKCERAKNKRKCEVKWQNKCKIRKNIVRAKKRNRAKMGKIIFWSGEGAKGEYSFQTKL